MLKEEEEEEGSVIMSPNHVLRSDCSAACIEVKRRCTEKRSLCMKGLFTVSLQSYQWKSVGAALFGHHGISHVKPCGEERVKQHSGISSSEVTGRRYVGSPCVSSCIIDFSITLTTVWPQRQIQ